VALQFSLFAAAQLEAKNLPTAVPVRFCGKEGNEGLERICRKFQ
jgi:hypothetical protein